MFTHLLVLADDRPNAFRIVASAMRLGRRLGSQVTVVYAIHASGITPGAAPSTSRDAVTRGDVVFARTRRLAHRLGVPCTCRFAFGCGADGWIADMANRFSCDLIVVPAVHDHAAMARLTHRRSPASVLVCP